MRNKFVHEPSRVLRQEPLRVPTDHRPSPEGRLVLNQGQDAKTLAVGSHGRGNYRDSVSDRCQLDERLRRGALQADPRLEMRNLACRIKPPARSEFSAQQQNRLIRELHNVDDVAAGQPVRLRQRDQSIDRI